LELYERRADLHNLARLSAKPGNTSAPGRRHLCHRLVRLDRDQRGIADDIIASANVPFHDLRLLQTFAEIGKSERLHEVIMPFVVLGYCGTRPMLCQEHGIGASFA
jgi:hypothetical protein